MTSLGGPPSPAAVTAVAMWDDAEFEVGGDGLGAFEALADCRRGEETRCLAASGVP